jgi:hypothetical protein
MMRHRRNTSKQAIESWIGAENLSHTPFTINPDATLTTNEIDNASGQLVVEQFFPSSIEQYNAQLAQLTRNTPHC